MEFVNANKMKARDAYLAWVIADMADKTLAQPTSRFVIITETVGAANLLCKLLDVPGTGAGQHKFGNAVRAFNAGTLKHFVTVGNIAGYRLIVDEPTVMYSTYAMPDTEANQWVMRLAQASSDDGSTNVIQRHVFADVETAPKQESVKLPEETCGVCVVLDRNLNTSETRSLLNVIHHIRGVLEVAVVPADKLAEYIVRTRTVREIQERIHAALNKIGDET